MNDPVDELPMPSDRARHAQAKSESETPLIEPPSVKLIVRLFLIPLVIVGIAVGVMFLIGRMAGVEPTFEEAIARLKNPGGARTADWLIGPGAKERYLDAKTLTDKMKSGLSEPERIKLTDELVDLLDNHVQSYEGEVQHFVLLALGRVWQKDAHAASTDDAEGIASRSRVAAALLRYAAADQVPTKKAAVLATVYLAGYDETKALTPMLIEKVANGKEDLDVRIAAATALGPLGASENQPVIDALHVGLSEGNPENVELVWSSALSLAQLNQADVADTILKLLSRDELSKMQYYDRESDPRFPKFRNLTEEEQQRILINTMIGSQKLKVQSVQDQLKRIRDTDPSQRVRAEGIELLDRAEPATRPG